MGMLGMRKEATAFGIKPAERPAVFLVHPEADNTRGDTNASEAGGSGPVLCAEASVAASMEANLTAMSKSTNGGTVSQRYQPRIILKCLQLSSHLKPGASMADVLADSADILGGDAASDVVDKLKGGQVALPSFGLLRQARIKLDYLNILFERTATDGNRSLKFVMLDSSPQLGFNFQGGREDRIVIPTSAFLTPATRANFDIARAFESRILPLATLAPGNAGTVKKLLTYVNIMLMESGILEKFEVSRLEIAGTTIDSEVTKDPGDEPVSLLHQFRDKYGPDDVKGRMFPKSLHIPGHLHIISNALETAVGKLDFAEEFMESLTMIQAFLSDKQLRNKFRSSCLKEGSVEFKMFANYSTVHISWRWEFLSKALYVL